MKKLVLFCCFICANWALNASETPYQIHTNVTNASCGQATGSVQIQLTNNYCHDLLQYITEGDCHDYDCYFEWLTDLQLEHGIPVPGWWYNLTNLEDWYLNGNHNLLFEELQLYLTQFLFVNCELTPKMDSSCSYSINLYDDTGAVVATGANINGLSSGIYRLEVLPNNNVTSINGCFEYYDFCAAETYVIINDFDLEVEVLMKGETCASVYNYDTWPADYFSGSADGYLIVNAFNFDMDDYNFEWFDFNGNLISQSLVANNLKMTPLDFEGCYNQLFENYTLKITDNNGCAFYKHFILGADNYMPHIQLDTKVSICNKPVKLNSIKMDLLGNYFDDFQYNPFTFPTWINGEAVDLETHDFYPGNHEIIIKHYGQCWDTININIPYYCYPANCEFNTTAIKVNQTFEWDNQTKNLYRLSNNQLVYFTDNDIELFSAYEDSLVINLQEHCLVNDPNNTENILIAWANCIDYKSDYDAYIEGCGENFSFNTVIECYNEGIYNMAVIVALYGQETAYYYNFETEFGNLNENGVIDMQENYGYYVTPALTEGDSYFLTISNADQNCVNIINGMVACTLTPIELLHFEALKGQNGNTINWQTASVIDEDYFVLEYSTNGVDFTDLAKLNAKQHHQGIQNYSYKHNSNACPLYYRLKTIDVNSVNRVVSNIEQISNCTTNTIKVYPTVSSSIVTIENALGYPVNIYNQMGEKVTVENNNNQLNISHLAMGIYYLNINENTFKIVKF